MDERGYSSYQSRDDQQDDSASLLPENRTGKGQQRKESTVRVMADARPQFSEPTAHDKRARQQLITDTELTGQVVKQQYRSQRSKEQIDARCQECYAQDFEERCE